MSPRSIRRAAERRQAKLARKLERTATESPILDVDPAEEFSVAEPTVNAVTEETPRPEPSAARLSANQANAQLSTGPRTPAGKAASSKNALKTALTGRTVLLASDDTARYQAHLAHYEAAYKPSGEEETALVQNLADTMWRLDRIPGLEEALYVRGNQEFANRITETDPGKRSQLLRLETYLAYEKQFKNLSIQETRLHRQREKLIAQIAELQTKRKREHAEELKAAAALLLKAREQGKPFHPSAYGFEFSTAQIECYIDAHRTAHIAKQHLSEAAA